MLRRILLIGGILCLSPPVIALGVWLFSIVFNRLGVGRTEATDGHVAIATLSIKTDFQWPILLAFSAVGACLILVATKLPSAEGT